MFIIGNLFRMCFLLKSNWILDKYRRVECSVYHRLCPEVAMKMLGLIQQRAGEGKNVVTRIRFLATGKQMEVSCLVCQLQGHHIRSLK